MRIYMGVTTDKYELPLMVAESTTELAMLAGTTKDNIRMQIKLRRSGRNRGMRYIMVEIDDERGNGYGTETDGTRVG